MRRVVIQDKYTDLNTHTNIMSTLRLAHVVSLGIVSIMLVAPPVATEGALMALSSCLLAMFAPFLDEMRAREWWVRLAGWFVVAVLLGLTTTILVGDRLAPLLAALSLVGASAAGSWWFPRGPRPSSSVVLDGSTHLRRCWARCARASNGLSLWDAGCGAVCMAWAWELGRAHNKRAHGDRDGGMWVTAHAVLAPLCTILVFSCGEVAVANANPVVCGTRAQRRTARAALANQALSTACNMLMVSAACAIKSDVGMFAALVYFAAVIAGAEKWENFPSALCPPPAAHMTVMTSLLALFAAHRIEPPGAVSFLARYVGVALFSVARTVSSPTVKTLDSRSPFIIHLVCALSIFAGAKSVDEDL